MEDYNKVYKLAKSYAIALYDICHEHNVLEKVLEQFKLIDEIISLSLEKKVIYFQDLNSKFLLSIITTMEKNDVKIDVWFKTFLNIIIANKRTHVLNRIYIQFENIYCNCNNISKVTVTVPNNKHTDIVDKITNNFASILKRDIKATICYDPDLLAGFTLQTGTSLIDASLENRLHLIEQALINEINIL